MTIEKARQILNEIKKTAEQASLTGSMKGGSGVFIKAYNAIFKYAVSQQWIADIGIVSEIDIADIGEGVKIMDYIGCSAGLLRSMLEEK